VAVVTHEIEVNEPRINVKIQWKFHSVTAVEHLRLSVRQCHFRIAKALFHVPASTIHLIHQGSVVIMKSRSLPLHTVLLHLPFVHPALQNLLGECSCHMDHEPQERS